MYVDLVAAIIAFIIAYSLVPVMRRLALRTGFVDMPTERKAHKSPLPMLGGAAMLVGFLIATVVIRHFFLKGAASTNEAFDGLIIGGVIMFCVGMVDDYAKTRSRDFPAWPKFLAQVIAAAILVYCGASIRGIQDPIHGTYYITFSSWFRDLITILWIVGIVNVFNFLDGLDGLAGGIAAMSASTLLIISIIKGDMSSAISAASLIGVTLAFLRFNFYPARIIMGDAGSTFIGYVLASIAVMGAFKSATIISIFVPVLALGVPIFDAVFVVARRLIEKRPVYKADRSHSHYRLMASGLTQIQTVSILYLVALGFSVVSIMIALVYR
ncbi:MAG: MraY family glycosyltransferase [Firmicutes bacterium]|nr:MraY family glycosyltransferase [Bacillota bacterium]